MQNRDPMSTERLDNPVVESGGLDKTALPSVPKLSATSRAYVTKPLSPEELNKSEAFLEKHVSNNHNLSAEAQAYLKRLVLSQRGYWHGSEELEISQQGKRITIRTSTGAAYYRVR